jgi:hypothetical protein
VSRLTHPWPRSVFLRQHVISSMGKCMHALEGPMRIWVPYGLWVPNRSRSPRRFQSAGEKNGSLGKNEPPFVEVDPKSTSATMRFQVPWLKGRRLLRCYSNNASANGIELFTTPLPLSRSDIRGYNSREARRRVQSGTPASRRAAIMRSRISTIRTGNASAE